MKIFVTPHAIKMWNSRCAYSPQSSDQAEAAIVAALSQRAFCCPSNDNTLTIWGCYTQTGYPVCIASDPADENADFLLIRTCGPFWYWHEARRLWQNVRGRKARRRKSNDRATRPSSADPLSGALRGVGH